ncbi:MAG: hypothetical protein HKO03_00580 [Acidimicrobiia bacterium]|nr:hypothetical protein [Acidimicrobiia bacterium]
MNLVASNPKDDRGAVLPLVALMTLVLFGMVGFAVDLGWVYLNASRVQNAADAAALAAVTRLPHVTPTISGSAAESLAFQLAADNGYPAGNVVVANVPLDPANPASRFNDYQVEVTVADDVDMFFSRVFGIDTMTVTRDAVAESLPPLALGGSSNTFGIGVSGGGDGFWAAINSTIDRYENGDPFSSANPVGGSADQGTDSIRTNRAAAGIEGYYYALDVPAGAGAITVFTIDAAYASANASSRYNDGRVQPLEHGSSMSTRFRLAGVDNSPFDYTDNTTILGCDRTYAPTAYPNNIALDPFDPTNPVVDILCVVPVTSEGIYPLHVTANAANRGGNSFGLAVSNTGSGTVKIYGLGSMSLSNTIAGGSSTVDLMRVPEEYAGRKIKASFFDPGDTSGGGNTTMNVLPDAGGISCTITRGDTNAFVGSDVGNCFVNTQNNGNRLYSGEWVHMTFDLPSTYSCLSDCWWRINNVIPAGVTANDRTTWRVEVEGNPVHLIG